MSKLQAGYLFPEIARRRNAHILKYPDAKVISLGIGDTTEPIPEVITSAMAKRSNEPSTVEVTVVWSRTRRKSMWHFRSVDFLVLLTFYMFLLHKQFRSL